MNPITQDTFDLLKSALSAPNDALSKAISTGTGLIAYDLQAPAKNLYPFITPLRNVIPRVGGGTGTATNWRQVNAIIGSGFDAMGWVPEGQRSGQMSYSTSNKSATYVTIGEEDAVTYEAIAAGVHFEDIQARMTFRLLQKMMLKEEMAILAGNAGSSAGGISLGTPTAPTVSAVTNTASTLNGTFYAQVVALTLEGYQNAGGTPLNTVAGTSNSAVTATSAIPTTKNIAGADGKGYMLSGGSSNISAISSGQAVSTSTSGLGLSTPVVNGAVAYAWFVGTGSTAGSGTLQAITTINSVQIANTLVAGTQSASQITADNSGNSSYAYNGLLTTAFAASNSYINALATGTTPGVGTFLTSSGKGGVVEIDQMFQTMWNNFELSPTVLYMNAQEIKNVTSKVLNGTSAPLLRYTQAGEGAEEFGITASGTVAWYYNPFNTGNGTQTGLRIPIRLHPRVPPGTIIGWAENLPIQYQSNEVPNVAEIKTRQDYYQIDWPIVTRQRQVGVYAESVLAIYAPFAMGVITNIGNG